MSDIHKTIMEIKSFEYSGKNWIRLDELVSELWETGNPELGIEALLEIFEKYPNETGEEVFWTILHGLESLDYEKKLFKSLFNKPSYMGIVMLKRIENSNTDKLLSDYILKAKKSILVNPLTEPNLLSEIQDLL